MLDAGEVVAEDHLRGCDAQLLGHVVDGAGLEDGQLARGDLEALLGDGGFGVAGGGGVERGAVERGRHGGRRDCLQRVYGRRARRWLVAGGAEKQFAGAGLGCGEVGVGKSADEAHRSSVACVAPPTPLVCCFDTRTERCLLRPSPIAHRLPTTNPGTPDAAQQAVLVFNCYLYRLCIACSALARRAFFLSPRSTAQHSPAPHTHTHTHTPWTSPTSSPPSSASPSPTRTTTTTPKSPPTPSQRYPSLLPSTLPPPPI